MEEDKVLRDYKNRTIKTVTNPRWSDKDHTILTVDVLFEELEESVGVIPFTTHEGADTDHGVEIWENAVAGEYDPIAEFVPLSPEVIREGMPALSARQIRLGLLELGKLRDVDTVIDTLPEPERSQAEVSWEYATTFNRLDPILLLVLDALQLTAEQVDEMWLKYLEI